MTRWEQPLPGTQGLLSLPLHRGTFFSPLVKALQAESSAQFREGLPLSLRREPHGSFLAIPAAALGKKMTQPGPGTSQLRHKQLPSTAAASC